MSVIKLLCIAGGGTGGHVMPALALADAARAKWPEVRVAFIGAERGLEAKLLPERGEQSLLLTMHSVQGASMAQKLRVMLWELPRAVLTIRRQWQQERPALVVGVGGYASVTGVLAALISRVPVILYEQNAIPGMVNRRLARFCQRVMLGFADAARWIPASNAVVTGNIVREAIGSVRWQAHTPPRLLVLGGSQGALFLNETVPAACRLLKEKGKAFRVTHVAGNSPQTVDSVINSYIDAGIDAEVIGFCNEMADFYASGDLLIARSGAMTVGEASACGMPALFVPLPHAADQHQFYNALTMADRQAAVIVNQHESDAADLAERIGSLLFDPERLAEMSRQAAETALIDARERQLATLAPWLSPEEAMS